MESDPGYGATGSIVRAIGARVDGADQSPEQLVECTHGVGSQRAHEALLVSPPAGAGDRDHFGALAGQRDLYPPPVVPLAGSSREAERDQLIDEAGDARGRHLSALRQEGWGQPAARD